MVEKNKIKQDDELFYKNLFTDKIFSFNKHPTEIVGTIPLDLIDNISEIESTNSLVVTQGINLRRRFGVFRSIQDLEVESVIRSIDTSSMFENVMPALIDEERLTRYFLPDEFTVQFKKEINQEEMEKIINDFNSDIIIKHRTRGYYTLAIPAGLGLFETLRKFSNLSQVAFAEPSEISWNPDFMK